MDRIERLREAMTPQERTLQEWQFALSRRLQQIMDEQDISQKELARRAGLTEPQVTAMIHMEANPTLGLLARIAALLDAELLTWINSDTPHSVPHAHKSATVVRTIHAGRS